MLAGVGVEHRIDAFTVEVPDTSVSGASPIPRSTTVSGWESHRSDPVALQANFKPMLRMNNQASMMKVQAAQLEDQIKFGEDEWRRYWE
jgi:hypothetical protein